MTLCSGAGELGRREKRIKKKKRKLKERKKDEITEEKGN